VVAVALPYRFWLRGFGGFLVHSDPPAHADMIVVLGGDFFGNRILKAGQLVREGFASQALVSGPGGEYGLHESDLAIPFAVLHGYLKSYFVAFPNEARSTQAEADAVIAELRRRHVHSVDVVTSNYHTRRAGRIFRSKARDLAIYMIAAPDRDFTSDGWWKTRDGRKVFADEWIKTVAEWVGL
jgi:uncharacterized SAM-binding protein YcdF (DUF218 family)